jgi:hypothetical protein
VGRAVKTIWIAGTAATTINFIGSVATESHCNHCLQYCQVLQTRRCHRSAFRVWKNCYNYDKTQNSSQRLLWPQLLLFGAMKDSHSTIHRLSATSILRTFVPRTLLGASYTSIRNKYRCYKYSTGTRLLLVDKASLHLYSREPWSQVLYHSVDHFKTGLELMSNR